VDRNVFGRPVARWGHLVLTNHTLKTTLSACWDSTVRCVVRSQRQDRLLRRLVRLPLGTLQGLMWRLKGGRLQCWLLTWQRLSVWMFHFVLATAGYFAFGWPSADVSFGRLSGLQLLLFLFRGLCLCLCPWRYAALVVVPHFLQYQMIFGKTPAVGYRACFGSVDFLQSASIWVPASIWLGPGRCCSCVPSQACSRCELVRRKLGRLVRDLS